LNATSLFSIGKKSTKRKLKIEKRNLSDFEVFPGMIVTFSASSYG